MSDIDRERMRKEAGDVVTSGPARPGESRVDTALRRYLGSSLFTMLGRDRKHSPQGAPSARGATTRTDGSGPHDQ